MSSRTIKWMDFPENPVFSIEYSGEPSYGKTHNLFTYPNVAVADTISEGDAHLIAKKFGNPKVLKAGTFDDLKRFVSYCCKSPKIESVGIDSGSDLVEMAKIEWLQETGRKSVYVPGKGGFQYAQVYSKIDKLVQDIKMANKYFVTTSALRDEWMKGVGSDESHKTGRRIRSGYHKFNFGLSVNIRLENGLLIDDKLHFENHIFGRVMKNRFLHKRVQKPFLFDSTYQGLVDDKELFTPWCASYNEEKCDLKNCARCKDYKPKDLLKEATEYLKDIGTIQEIEFKK